ncbi:MAG: biopolymer transporter ExbD [Verrucomicrobiales bacterium]|nr:biopolymer transporter ExbD [Verrucomicrobiales bacterium]
MRIPRKKFAADVPSTAMGDIAFLLLIFFVILARAVDDSHLQWEPAQVEEVEPSGAALASVVIDADQKLYLNGKTTTMDALPGQLEALLGDTEPGKRRVFLKADRETPASLFQPAIEAISMSGGDLLHVLNREDEPVTSTPSP